MSWKKLGTLVRLRGDYKQEMKTVCDKDNCAGCMACLEVCSKKAIEIRDTLDAYNAVINEEKCVNCGQCQKVCQANHQAIGQKPVYWWQGWASKESVRLTSSSGGAAQAIEQAFVENGGCVCSCKFTDGKFGFYFSDNVEDVTKFCGSKYVKSSPVGIYKDIKRCLLSGRKLLFVGLPCQVAAIKKYVGKSLQENLYTIDLICHGTPSPQLLNIFLQQYHVEIDTIKDIQFRTKTKYQIKENQHFIGPRGTLDNYSIAFLNSICYTANCYQCQYAKLERISDITLGDSWGSKLELQEQKKGISLILCQTPKGKDLINMANIELCPVNLDEAVKHNHQLAMPSKKPKKRELFLEKIQEGYSFNKAVRLCYPKQCTKQFIKAVLIKAKILRGE